MTASRPLGFWTCVALVMGNMIGAGVFLLPASLAPYGWNAVFAWGLTIGGGVCIAVVLAALAAALPRAGGPYAFVREAFGPEAGFAVAWSYWVSMWIGNAAIATGAISFLTVLVPALADRPDLYAPLTCALIWTFTLVNCFSLRAAGGVQVLTTVLKILPLVAAIGLAAAIVSADGGASLAPLRTEDISLGAITAAATLTLWTMLGLECATVPAGEVADPGRTIPRATLVGTIATGTIYLLAISAVILLMPSDVIAGSPAPFADFIARSWGEGARLAVAAFALISAVGCLNGWILCQGELPRAMARDGVFPQFFAVTSSRGTPVRAHLVASSLLTLVVVLNFSKSMADLFTFLVLLATSSSLVMYLMSALAALRLGGSRRLAISRAAMAAAAIAAVYSLWTLTGAGVEAVLWGAALLASGIPVYYAGRWRSAPAAEAAE